MTEGNGHVIDPNGDARRALQEAVAEHGPEVLSDAGVMENVCRDHLAGLPGESILIGDAARTNVPALLNDLIPQLGNYGAIQSAAATLAGEHSLDMAASLWVVREFARALGYIAPATGTATAFPGSGPRPVPGSGPRPVPGSGPPAGAGPAERPRGTGGATGAAEGSGTAGAGSEESENVRLGDGEAGRAVAGGAAAGATAAVAGVAADEAGRGESAGSEAATSGPGTSGPGTSGPGTSGPGTSGPVDSGATGTSGASLSGASLSGASLSGTSASGSEPGYGTGPASGGTGQALGSPGAAGQASGAPGTTGPADGGPGATGPAGGSGPVSTGPMRDVPGASGPAAGGAWGGPSAPGGTAGSGTGGGGGWGGATGGAAPEGDPGFPLPLPAGRLPGRQSQRSKLLNRNTVGIAAAIALIAGYLGVAAVAHLSPFPAKTVPTASSSQSSSPPASSSSSPASSPDPSADPSPPSQLDILLTKIPSTVRRAGECLNAGTGSGATAVIQCQKLQGLAANTIIYYLYPNTTALANGLSSFFKQQKFLKRRECTTNGNFSDFLVNCESKYVIKTPGTTGSIAEYVKLTDQNPVIVSTDNEQNVMAVLVGTSDGDLLAYWNQLKWVVTP